MIDLNNLKFAVKIAKEQGSGVNAGYPILLKLKVVEFYNSQKGVSINKFAKSIGLVESSLRKWIKQEELGLFSLGSACSVSKRALATNIAICEGFNKFEEEKNKAIAECKRLGIKLA